MDKDCVECAVITVCIVIFISLSLVGLDRVLEVIASLSVYLLIGLAVTACVLSIGHIVENVFRSLK